jgi:2-methylcitrate dehydratase
MTGEMGYPSALSGKNVGFPGRAVQGQAAHTSPRAYGTYVMENVLFKISFPAEFHAQTAVEAAMTAACRGRNRLDDIESVVIETQEAGRAHHRQDRSRWTTRPIATTASST